MKVLNQDETPLLYSLVFGEGVVNDATSVVLFNAIQKINVKRVGDWTHVLGSFLYLFFASTALGITTGLLTAYALKALYFGRYFTYSGVTMDTINATMVTTTVIVVLFTTLVFGFLTKPLILYLVPHAPSREAKSPKEDLTLPMLSMDESTATNLSRAKDSLTMLLERPIHTIHSYWRKFDDAYMRPFFGGPTNHHRR
ncbi:hypothetical protein SOVF_171840 [Spinacia oleracea]|nr:hypothetical protein SOVF_171840 [Spinacia oleracea]